MSNRFEKPQQEAAPEQGASGRGMAKASTGWSALRCAGLASLALAGCVVANVAGCGGGGGGATVVPTPALGTATILLVNANGQGVNGTVTLNGTTLTTTNSRAVFRNLQPGTYPLVFTVGGVSTRSSIVVTRESNQNFVAVPGLSNVSSNGIRVSGRTLLNSPSDSVVAACNSSSTPVTGPLLIRVRSLNLPGRPIVSSLVRPANRDGRYVIFTIPSAGTYRVEARSVDATGAPFAGASASFTINPGQTVVDLDICTNQSANEPGGTPPPPPGTPTAGPGTGTPGATPTGTLTPGAVATNTPDGTPGGTPGVTNTPDGTPGGTPGATETPGGVPTPTTQPTQTPIPTNTPLPTPGPGTPQPTATPTATTIGGNPPVDPTTGRQSRRR